MSYEHRPTGDVAECRVAIVMSQYHAEITDSLLHGALAALRALGIADDHIELARVPGTLEIPLGLAALLEQGRHDAAVALGCIVRGQTPHFEYVARETFSGCMQVSLAHKIPIGMGVLTVDDLAQAEQRADAQAHAGTEHLKHAPRATANKGAEAARTAVSMAQLLKAIAAS